MNFKDFMAAIDDELRQSENSTRANVPDKYRLARESEVKRWVDQSIGTLMTMNLLYWERTIEFTPIEDSEYIEIPYLIRTLRKICVDGTWHHIYNSATPNSYYYWAGGRKIVANLGSFSKGQKMWLEGTLRRETVIDENSEIDFPEDHIRLLLLQVLLKRSSRDEHKKGLWYSEAQELKLLFKKDLALAQIVSTIEPSVGFGV